MSHATVAEFLKLAVPPVSLFQHPSLTSGPITEPEAAEDNMGGGTVELGPRSVPWAAYSGRVLVTQTGEINTAGVINLVGVPKFKVSLNGGTSYSRPLYPDGNGRIAYPEGGFTLYLRNATEGEQVNFGSGNAQLQVKAKQAGMSLAISVGTELAHEFDGETGEATLTVATTTTAAQARTYLLSSGLAVAVAYGGTGAGVVQAASRASLPYASFIADDHFTFTTSDCPVIVTQQEAAHDELSGYLAGTYGLPVSSVGMRVKEVESVLARWKIITFCGLDKDKDMQNYHPEMALAWLRDVQAGHIPATLTETGSRRFVTMVTQPGPLSEDAGTIPI